MLNVLKKLPVYALSRPRMKLLYVMGAVGLVGLAMLYVGRAATPTASIEPENSNLSSNAVMVSDPTASGAKAIKFGVARVFAMQPFSPTSIWNIPLHDGVSYSAASDLRNKWRTETSGVLNYQSDWNLAVWQAKDNSPLVTIKANRDLNYPVWPSSGATHRVPADGVVPGPDGDGTYNVQYDGWVTIISPDGKTAIELYKAKWLDPGKTLQAAYAYSYALDGEDPRSSGGLKASNFSYLGGVIRKWEMTSTVPAATRIRHALSLSLPRGNLKAPYQWPATGQDYGWETDYKGYVPMGTCFALPWTFDIENSGLTDDGRALAYALRNYGAWVGDASGNASIYAEMNSPSAKGVAYTAAWQALIPHLVAVDGRTASAPGGPGAPRVPIIGAGVFGQITP